MKNFVTFATCALLLICSFVVLYLICSHDQLTVSSFVKVRPRSSLIALLLPTPTTASPSYSTSVPLPLTWPDHPRSSHAHSRTIFLCEFWRWYEYFVCECKIVPATRQQIDQHVAQLIASRQNQINAQALATTVLKDQTLPTKIITWKKIMQR